MSRPRVVVIGNGMAGSRVVEEIRKSDPQRLVELTVIGSETHHSYNRILLSEVLAGRHRRDAITLAAPDWHERNDVTVKLGCAVQGIDRDRRVVLTDSGEIPYDIAVIATGSNPRIPPIAGLSHGDQLVENAHVFRTLDDCDAISKAADSAERAVVLGGGLLGIEAARGLAGRGVPVVVVHAASHLMERQLDIAGGRILARTLTDLGVTVRVGGSAQSIIFNDAGQFGGLALDDGSFVLGDLLVVATGVIPNVDIARQAGLSVDSGIVVDDHLRSVSDPRIFAVGECAQHRGDVYGLVAPAWEQAAVVAAAITGSDPGRQFHGSRLVTRLKAEGIEMASMGNPLLDDDDHDIVQVADPQQGTYARVVLRDNRIAGAIVIGKIAGIGTLTTLFDRDARMPSDRLRLLMPVDNALPAVTQATSPATIPTTAVICKCNGVTKETIQSCVLDGARTVEQVAAETRATTGCGGCKDAVCGIVDWLNKAEPAQSADLTALASLESPSLEKVS